MIIIRNDKPYCLECERECALRENHIGIEVHCGKCDKREFKMK